MIEIKTGKIKDTTVSVPGSKSYTHRILIAEALSDGKCVIDNVLQSEDTLFTIACLKKMGIKVEAEEGRFYVHGTGGRLQSPKEPMDLGNSGTSMRLLTAVAALGQGRCVLSGTQRMQQRPIQDLLDGLNQLGVIARSVNRNGCPPVEITGGNINGGKVSLDCHISSQFLSALLLVAPFAKESVEILVIRGPVSRPYVDITVSVMETFGATVMRDGYEHFTVPGGQKYQSGAYTVEPDYSQAGYFWAAAAISGAGFKVKKTAIESRQGDVRFTEVLKKMGCEAYDEKDGIRIVGKPLTATTVDMGDMPDIVPTLAVVAAFAKGTTVIENVAHLKDKESDRLSSVARELSKMGIEASATDSGLIIKGGTPHGAEIETYNDHRIAMSFALAGLRVKGVKIKNETCVKKSFPDFWEVFGQLYQ